MSSAGQNKSAWYRQSFGDLYPLIYAHRNLAAATDEIQRLARWAPLNARDNILDVCCGNGRHLEAIVNLGCHAVGFDLSPELIEKANSRDRLKGRVFRGDIRRIPVGKQFDLVVNLFTSFGYFQDDNENVTAFNEMARCVKSRGVLILDHMNASRIRETLVPESRHEKKGYVIEQQRRIVGLRVQKRIRVTRSSDGSEWTFFEDVRMYEPLEMIRLAREAGFREISLHGSFNGEAFETESERMILRAV